jgi:hypothetical protein
VVGHLSAVSDAVPDTNLCRAAGGAFVPGPGDVPESGNSTITGTFQGTGRFCGHTTGAPDAQGRVRFVEIDVFTGAVRGCGRGSVTYQVEGTVGLLPDASRGGLPTEEDWQIVPRSGTGGLRGVLSGGGHDKGELNPDGSIDTDFVGRVTCVPHRGS